MTVIPFPDVTKLEKEIKGLFQVLPFDIRAEGAQKLSKEMGYKIDIWRIDHLLSRVRSNPKKYGYSIPHAKRGRRLWEEEGPRYVGVRNDHSTDPHFTEDEEAQVRNGMVSCVSALHTSSMGQANAMIRAAPYCNDSRTKRLCLKTARDLQRVSEDVADLQELMNGDGSAA